MTGSSDQRVRILVESGERVAISVKTGGRISNGWAFLVFLVELVIEEAVGVLLSLMHWRM